MKSSDLRNPWINICAARKPYAYSVVQFNGTLNTDNRGSAGRDIAIERSKTAASELAFRADQAFFEERFVQNKISAYDRFHAVVTVEKAGTSTHINILWCLPEFEVSELDAVFRDFVPSLFSRQSKLEFLLRRLNNSSTPLLDRDTLFLDQTRFHDPQSVNKDLERLISPWSVYTQSISSTDDDIKKVCEYCTKESKRDADFSDLVFELRQFHKTGQRQQGSRCWEFPRAQSGKAVLDLTAPLKFR